MKLINIVFVLFLFIFVSGCSNNKETSKVNFKNITGFEEISENKMTFLFLSKPGCKWCKKQKEDFENLGYIQKYPAYDFIKIESDEALFKKFQSSAFRVSSFPTLLVLQRNDKEFIVVEKIEGYARPDVLEPILEFNKDLVNK